MTNYPVEYFTGIDQLQLIVDAALNRAYQGTFDGYNSEKDQYCILPIHVKPGKMAKIVGKEKLEAQPFIQAIVPVHHVGDEIQDWGTAQQVCFYVHFTYKNQENFFENLKKLKEELHVLDSEGNEQLFYLMDTSTLKID